MVTTYRTQDFIHRLTTQNHIQNKQYHVEELLKRFGLNGNTIGFRRQAQKLQLDSVLVSIIDSCRTKLLILTQFCDSINCCCKQCTVPCEKSLLQSSQISREGEGTSLPLSRLIQDRSKRLCLQGKYTGDCFQQKQKMWSENFSKWFCSLQNCYLILIFGSALFPPISVVQLVCCFIFD